MVYSLGKLRMPGLMGLADAALADAAASDLHPEGRRDGSPSPSPVQPQPQQQDGASGLAPDNSPVINALADMTASRAAHALDTALRLTRAVGAAPRRAADDFADDDERAGKRSRRGGNAAADPLGSGGRAGNKGLRHFSKRVCERVRSFGRTTYNEVADHLVTELQSADDYDGAQYDEKNIRRRVYDAINVLMAIGIIVKEGKDVVWQGFPTAATPAPALAAAAAASPAGPSSARWTATPDVARPAVERSAAGHMQAERRERMEALGPKLAFLQDLIEHQRGLAHLLARPQDSLSPRCTKLHLPLIILQAKGEAEIHLSLPDDMRNVKFDFLNSPFQVHDQAYVLRQLMAMHDDTAAADGPGHSGGGRLGLEGQPSLEGADLGLRRAASGGGRSDAGRGMYTPHPAAQTALRPLIKLEPGCQSAVREPLLRMTTRRAAAAAGCGKTPGMSTPQNGLLLAAADAGTIPQPPLLPLPHAPAPTPPGLPYGGALFTPLGTPASDSAWGPRS